MIISNHQIQNVLAAYQKRLEIVRGQGTEVGRRVPSRSDRLEISPDAQELARLVEMVRQLPDVRADRLRELAEALAAGTYDVSGRDIAEKMWGRFLADRLQ